MGLKCVRETRQAIGEKHFILGMGGIETAKDVIDYFHCRADAVGIGTGLVGMDDMDLQSYFSALDHH